MSRLSQKSRRFRSVMFESLQRRELMAADLSLITDPANPYVTAANTEQWAERVLNSYEFSPWMPLSSGPLTDIKKFSSEQEVQKHLTDALVKTWERVLGKDSDELGDWGFRIPDIQDAVLASITPRANANELQQTRDLTTYNATNVQVRSVDEADRFEVSADGYIFALGTGGGLIAEQVTVFDARDPNNLRKVASIDIQGFSAQLHLVGDQLILLTSEFPLRPEGFRDFRTDSISRIQVFDVSDPSKPTLQSNLTVEGANQQSRVVDGMLTLFGSNYISALRPQFISQDPTDPAADSKMLTDVPVGRFETAEEFSARIQPLVLGWILPGVKADGSDVELNPIGWQDLVVSSNGDYRQQFSVTTFKLTEGGLEYIDGETILGPSTWTTYVDDNTIYTSYALSTMQFVGTENQPVPPRTQILSFQFDADGVEFVASGVVPGSIRDSRMMDEYQGNLRVFSDIRSVTLESEVKASSDLYILKATAGKLEIIGQLTDVADGQALYSGFFDEDQAMITTWVSVIPNQWSLFRPDDPLHTFDLSDPTKPVELSELVIPGVSTYLQRIDANHLVGIGYIDFGSGDWRQQVSLYDVSDLKNPKVVDTWSSDSSFFSPNFNGWNQNALAVQFDATSGLFSIAFSAFGSFSSPGLSVFKIDSSDQDPLRFVGEISDVASTVSRSTVVGDTLFVISDVWLRSFAVDDISTELGRGLLAKPGVPDWMQAKEKQTIELKLLANDHTASGRVISMTSQIGAQFKILDDGVTVEYQVPDIEGSYSGDELTYTVQLENGETYSSIANIQIYGAPPIEIGPPPIEVIVYEPISMEPVDIQPIFLPPDVATKTSLVECDVSGDGEVSPLDALLLLEHLNRQSELRASGEGRVALNAATSIMDISGDGELSPIDLFLLVKRLNTNAAVMVASGEGADDLVARPVVESHVADEALISLLASNYADQEDVMLRSKRSIVRN